MAGKRPKRRCLFLPVRGTRTPRLSGPRAPPGPARGPRGGRGWSEGRARRSSMPFDLLVTQTSPSAQRPGSAQSDRALSRPGSARVRGGLSGRGPVRAGRGGSRSKWQRGRLWVGRDRLSELPQSSVLTQLSVPDVARVSLTSPCRDSRAGTSTPSCFRRGPRGAAGYTRSPGPWAARGALSLSSARVRHGPPQLPLRSPRVESEDGDGGGRTGTRELEATERDARGGHDGRRRKVTGPGDTQAGTWVLVGHRGGP